MQFFLCDNFATNVISFSSLRNRNYLKSCPEESCLFAIPWWILSQEELWIILRILDHFITGKVFLSIILDFFFFFRFFVGQLSLAHVCCRNVFLTSVGCIQVHPFLGQAILGQCQSLSLVRKWICQYINPSRLFLDVFLVSGVSRSNFIFKMCH